MAMKATTNISKEVQTETETKSVGIQTSDVPPKANYENATDGTKVIVDDPWLEPFADVLRARHTRFIEKKKELEQKEGGILKFSEGYKIYGFHRVKGGIVYRELAPGAKQIFLMGDFNQWNRDSHELKRDDFGVFSITLPDNPDGTPAIKHKTKLKIAVVTPTGSKEDRIPAWIKVAWLEDGKRIYDGVYWEPPENETYKFKYSSPPVPPDLRIYESHVGMSSTEPKVSSYWEFAHNVIPYIAELGYNCVQIMGIMEHAYYASFGYQVTNFFAVSSRFGTPEELKELVDIAHKHGLLVFLDLVHSHASKNVADGLNQFDGTDHHYFHEGTKGNHPIWDSRLFNYGNYEVLRFVCCTCLLNITSQILDVKCKMVH